MLIVEQILSLILLIAEFIVVAAMILILVSGIASSIYGAPYVPIRKKLIKNLLFFGGLSAGDIFYDLGSGDGRILISAVKNFRIQEAIGYEIALWPYLKSKFLIQRAGLGNNIDIERKNFFGADLSQATLIYIYLFPRLVDRLAGKIAGECQSGTKVLCPSFPIDIARYPKFKLLKSEKVGRITAYLYEKI
jgi:hypothetical protein